LLGTTLNDKKKTKKFGKYALKQTAKKQNE